MGSGSQSPARESVSTPEIRERSTTSTPLTDFESAHGSWTHQQVRTLAGTTYPDRTMDVREATSDDADLIGELLYDFNTEFDEPTPSPAELATRIRELLLRDTVVLLAGDVGLVLLRFQPSLWSRNDEAYLAELYVRPESRGAGIGKALLSATLEVAKERGADYIHLGTTEDDVAARHLYESMGFRRTEGDDGPLMFVYEREL